MLENYINLEMKNYYLKKLLNYLQIIINFLKLLMNLKNKRKYQIIFQL